MTTDISSWARRNIHPLPSGEVAVRPGLRRIFTVESSWEIDRAWTVRNARTSTVWHYFLETRDGYASRVRIVDENFQLVQRISVVGSTRPRAATLSIVADQVCICSPDFDMLHGYVGATLSQAAAVDSINPQSTVVDPIPRGIGVSWATRLVIANDRGVWFSDPLEPRTFAAGNVNFVNDTVYGLHVAAQGALVMATRGGLQALPEDASAAGQVVFGAYSRPDEYPVTDFDTTQEVRGIVWQLTRKGLRQAFPQGDELPLSEPEQTRRYGPRIHHVDYRAGRLIDGQEGPFVAIEDDLHTFDMGFKSHSWWTAAGGAAFKVVGTLERYDGEEMLVARDGVYRVYGNFDGDKRLTSENATPVIGLLSGRIESPPAQKLVVREVEWASNTGGRNVLAVNGEVHPGEYRQPAQVGIVVGTSSWGAGAYLKQPEKRSATAQFAVATRDVQMELGAENPKTLLSMGVDIKTKANERPDGES